MIGQLTGEGEVVKKKHCHFHLETVTFEHRHENKTCSACPKDQHKHLTYDILHMSYVIRHMTSWQTITFEHRHENKSCSACPKDQHKQLTFDTWHLTFDTWHLTLDIWHSLKYRIKVKIFLADFRWQYLGNGSFDLRCAKSPQWGLLAHQFSSKSDKPFPSYWFFSVPGFNCGV